MATLKGLPRFTVSDAAQFNQIVTALSTVLVVTDDAQVFIRPTEIRFGTATRRLYRSGDDLHLQDATAGDKTLNDLVATAPPAAPPFLEPATATGGGGGVQTTNRIYLLPTLLYVSATVTGIRFYVKAGGAAGNVIVGLYSSTGARLAQSASTATSANGNFQTISFSASYAAAGGLYYLAIIANYGTLGLGRASWFGPTAVKIVDPGSYSLPDPITIPSASHDTIKPGLTGVISGGII